MKALEQPQWRLSGIFIVNYEHMSRISHASASIIDLEQVNVCWVR